jgi:outer membrane protein assembly factor BamB
VSGPAYAFDNTVYAYAYATEPVKLAYLVALDAASSSELWTFPGIIGLTPLMATADTVYATSQSGRFHAIDATSGEERWSFEMSDTIRSRPCVADGLVFIDGPSACVALDIQTGEERWSFASGTSGLFQPEAVANGVVYVGSLDCLYALETTTGNEIWRFETNNQIASTNATVGEGIVSAVYDNTSLMVFGNLPQAILIADVAIRGTPSTTGVERGTAKKGTIVSLSGPQEERGSQTWAAVTIDGVSGWITLDAIDPATLPPRGEIEYVYQP